MSEDEIAEMLPEGEERMFVLTNSSGINGATALLSREALMAAQAKLKEPYWAICSSVHELILIPRSSADPAVLRQINMEVNETMLLLERFHSQKKQRKLSNLFLKQTKQMDLKRKILFL